MKINYPQIGIYGLSCLLCPNYHSDAKSRYPGCKSENRMTAGCPFLTYAIKNKRVGFCWDCQEHPACESGAISEKLVNNVIHSNVIKN